MSTGLIKDILNEFSRGIYLAFCYTDEIQGENVKLIHGRLQKLSQNCHTFCGNCQINKADFGVFGMIERFNSIQGGNRLLDLIFRHTDETLLGS